MNFIILLELLRIINIIELFILENDINIIKIYFSYIFIRNEFFFIKSSEELIVKCV